MAEYSFPYKRVNVQKCTSALNSKNVLLLHLTLKIIFMASLEDYEKLLFLYKTEGKNMFVGTFCVHNGINYRSFDK